MKRTVARPDGTIEEKRLVTPSRPLPTLVKVVPYYEFRVEQIAEEPELDGRA